MTHDPSKTTSETSSTCLTSPMFHLEASWSLAGVGTSLLLSTLESNDSHKKPVKIAFDVGATPIFDQALSSQVVCVTHGHLDHVGGIFNHARGRHILYGGGSNTPIYYVPQELVEPLNKCLEAMEALDAFTTNSSPLLSSCSSKTDKTNNNKSSTKRKKKHGESGSLLPMKIVGVKPGQHVDLPSNMVVGNNERLFLRTFAVNHRNHPSIGYVLGRRLPSKLLPQYQNIPPRDIGTLVKRGVKIKADPVDVLEVAYTGDTCAKGLLIPPRVTSESEDKEGQDDDMQVEYLKQALRCPLVLCELTYLHGEKDEHNGDDGGKREEEGGKHISNSYALSKDTADAATRENSTGRSPSKAVLSSPQKMAEERGHMHLKDISRVFLQCYQWQESRLQHAANQRLVFVHLSARYRYRARYAMEQIVQGLPAELVEQCEVSVSSLLRGENKKTKSDGAAAAGGDFGEEDSVVLDGLVQDNGCIALREFVAVVQSKEKGCVE